MTRQRPLSPHLQVYRPQLTSMMSIIHRATGVALTTGTLVLAAWLVAVAIGGETYKMVAMAVAHPLGQFVLFGYSVVLFYHASNGVRHLTWDMGFGLEIPQVYATGRIVLAATVILTGIFWFLV